MSVVANVAINVDSSNAVSKLRQVQGQAQQTERAFGGIAAAVGKLAIAFAGIQAIKFVFAKTAELESQARSLQVLTGSAEKAGRIIKELQQLGAVTPFTSTELIDSAKRLQAFGVEADKVVETTKRLADVSGATGAELSGLVTAYGQVQAKGRLQGEELLQFQERGVALQTELRKMYGLSGEEFQKALEKGRIGSEAVEVAILRLTNAGGKYANGAIAQSDTLNGKLSTLQDSFEQLARNIGTFFEPVFKFLIDGINAFLDRVNNGLRVSAQLKANEQAAIQTRQKFGGFRAANPFDQEAQRFEANLRQSLLKSALSTGRGAAPKAPTPAPATPGLLNAATAGGAARGGAGTGAKKGNDDAKRAAEEKRRAAEELANLQGQVTLKEKLFGIDKQIAVERQRGSLVTAAALEMDKALEERQARIAEITRSTADTATKNTQIKEATLDADQKIYAVQQTIKEQEAERTKQREELMTDLVNQTAVETQLTEEGKRQVLLEQAIAKLTKDGVLITDEQINAYKNANAELDKTKEKVAAIKQQQEMLDNLYAGIAGTIASGVGGAIDAISGNVDNLGETLQSLASDILKAVGKMLIFYALAQAFGALGGDDGVGVFSFLAKAFGGGRASGGPVAPNTNYIVGENGPELLSMGGSGGKVYSNNDSNMRSAMSRYSRGARGEGVIPASGGSEGSDTPSATGGPMAIDVRYSVERINDVEYVTASQFQAGMLQAAQQGAAQGEQRTLRRLQQSPSTRKRVGV